MKNITYKVQARDNLSQNIIEYNGMCLDENDHKQKITRQKRSSRASSITLNGKQIASSDRVKVFYTSSDFLVEAITEQQDSAGRNCAMIVYGERPKNMSEEWISDLILDIQRFLNRDEVQLSLNLAVYESIENTLKEIFLRKRGGAAIARQDGSTSLSFPNRKRSSNSWGRDRLTTFLNCVRQLVSTSNDQR